MSLREPQQVSLCDSEISQIVKAKIEQAGLAQEVDEFLQLYGFEAIAKEFEADEESGALFQSWTLGTGENAPSLVLRIDIESLQHEWGFDGENLPPFVRDIRREVSRKRPH